MIVADASVVVELLLGGRRGRAAERHLLEAGDAVEVPALLDAEVAAAFRRLVARGEVEPARGEVSIEILREMPLVRRSMTPLLPRIWRLRETLTAYDACYVALAEALGCPLLTFDRRIAGAPGHGARVVVPEA